MKVETRKTEERFTTNNLDEMKNKYLAEPVVLSYPEDFIDETTGQVVTISRTELLYNRGALINGEMLTKLNFYLQSGDVKEVTVSNQRREAVFYNYSVRPHKVKAHIGGKPYGFILTAKSLYQALEIVTDYIELNYSGQFTIGSVKALENFIILKESFTKKDLTEEEKKRAEFESRYYMVDASIKTRKIFGTSEEDITEDAYSFLVKTKDVDNAKALITAYTEQFRDQRKDTTTEIAIMSATPYAISKVIDADFCAAYREE